MCFQSEFSDFVQNPSISQPSLNNFKRLKHSFDVFVTTVIVHYYYLDEYVGCFQKLEDRVLEKYIIDNHCKKQKVFLDIIKVSLIF